MTIEQIKETEIFKEISKMSNSQRGYAFDNFNSKIEEKLECKLQKRSYTELGHLGDNPMLSFEDKWQPCGPVCFIMEFVPNS